MTLKGQETIKIAEDRVLRVAKMMMYGLLDEDKQLCIKLLTPIDERFTGTFQKQKNKTP
ncbi:hypothetical protein [Mucilaginibacter pocheonensis]|uniref:Uncharacterized protein n=1 Tax=Mucilaginibacter pocheonensis TaxID=398050 RepID=A0ABU1T6J4_9SPHI|nr:hypothetical protein [Mucilaginibacter pocheonensis]MDR6941012.1 hypothetical protein [Mucilaginibacter pocheonensis]